MTVPSVRPVSWPVALWHQVWALAAPLASCWANLAACAVVAVLDGVGEGGGSARGGGGDFLAAGDDVAGFVVLVAGGLSPLPLTTRTLVACFVVLVLFELGEVLVGCAGWSRLRHVAPGGQLVSKAPSADGAIE